jgi:hypothetical protein
MSLFVWIRRWRGKRDAEAIAAWNRFIATPSSGAEIFQLKSIRQKAHTGLKGCGKWITILAVDRVLDLCDRALEACYSFAARIFSIEATHSVC